MTIKNPITREEFERLYLGQFQAELQGYSILDTERQEANGRAITYEDLKAAKRALYAGLYSNQTPVTIQNIHNLPKSTEDPVASQAQIEKFEAKAPTSAREDRLYLKMDIPDYRDLCEAVMKDCYRDKKKQHCSLKGAKLKKLKDLRFLLTKNPKLACSMIYKELIRRIEVEINKRQAMPSIDRRRPRL